MNTKYLYLILSIISISCFAQKNEQITVKAGTSIQDNFTFQKTYRYPEFREGKVFFKNGKSGVTMLNYNFLKGEMDFIQLTDTLYISNKNDIKIITAESDTFYYDKGYLEMISGGPVKVAVKQYFKQLAVIKKDPYGISSQGSASTSNTTLPANARLYKLNANQDVVFEKILEYYLATPTSGFMLFIKKNVMLLFPQKKDDVKDYLKSNRVDFDSREDLLRLVDYLRSL
jgi:hypothetical protein